jgi:hypothetical protein
LATYTQPTGFLAATFPTTVASTTNITAASGVTVAAIGSNVINAASIASGALDGKGNWNVGKTGYALTQTFPANFASFAITVGGAVTVGTNNDKTGYTASTVSDKTGYSLLATTGLGNQTANITGNLSGSVGSVTAAVTTSAFSGAAETQIDNIETQATDANNEATNASGIATHFATMIELDGLVYRFTTNALENAPHGGGGGGGSGDWTNNEKDAIRAILGIPGSGSTPVDPTSGILDTIRDLVVAVDTVVDAILVDTETTIPGLISTVDSQVDSIVSTVGAIENVTDKLDTMLVLDGAVYQFTANALDNAPSGGGGGGGDPWETDLVVGGYAGNEAGAILLGVKAKADLITSDTVFVSSSSDGQTIKAYYLESRSIDVPMSESLVGKTIEFTCEDAQGATLETVANGSLSRTASSVSVPLTTATTAYIGNHYWSIRDITGGIDRVVAQGVLSVSYAASNDA